MKAFLARHPETEQALKVIKGQPVSSGFGNSTFHGLNAFRFINAAGDSIPVRWLLTPVQPFEAAKAADHPGQELSVRRADRTDSPPAVAMASHRSSLGNRAIPPRRHHRLAGGAGTGGCGNPDARSSRE